jgi:hypothetical protein
LSVALVAVAVLVVFGVCVSVKEKKRAAISSASGRMRLLLMMMMPMMLLWLGAREHNTDTPTPHLIIFHTLAPLFSHRVRRYPCREVHGPAFLSLLSPHTPSSLPSSNKIDLPSQQQYTTPLFSMGVLKPTAFLTALAALFSATRSKGSVYLTIKKGRHIFLLASPPSLPPPTPFPAGACV